MNAKKIASLWVPSTRKKSKKQQKAAIAPIRLTEATPAKARAKTRAKPE